MLWSSIWFGYNTVLRWILSWKHKIPVLLRFWGQSSRESSARIRQIKNHVSLQCLKTNKQSTRKPHYGLGVKLHSINQKTFSISSGSRLRKQPRPSLQLLRSLVLKSSMWRQQATRQKHQLLSHGHKNATNHIVQDTAWKA